MNELNYDRVSNSFQRHQLGVDAAEVQGIICGMLAGGMNVDDREWLSHLPDYINNGEALPKDCNQVITDIFNQVCQQFIEPDFALDLFLPDDSTPINERGLALVNWVQGFLLGFGLHQNDLTACSEEVKEALQDFSEIARMDEAMQENEESEQALFEVMEYVRISAMLCFNELGKSLLDARQPPSSVIH